PTPQRTPSDSKSRGNHRRPQGRFGRPGSLARTKSKKGSTPMNKTEKTLKELLEIFHAKYAAAISHDSKASKARIEAAKALLELRHRIESGEAGAITWWQWFKENSDRSRGDAEKLLAIAKAEDPEAAVEEERRKAREGMAEMRRRRTANNGDVSGKSAE